MKIEITHHYFKPNERYFTITTWSSCDRYELHVTGSRLVIDRKDEAIHIFHGDERKAVGSITVEPGLFESVVKSITEDGLIENIQYVPQLFNVAPKFNVGDEVFVIIKSRSDDGYHSSCIDVTSTITNVYEDGNGNFCYALKKHFSGYEVFQENEVFRHRTDLAMELDRLERENKKNE